MSGLGPLLRRALPALLALLALAAFLLSPPALAHKEHKKQPGQTEQLVARPPTDQPTTVVRDPNVMHAQMGEMMEGMHEDRSQMTMTERSLDWLGRLHPMIVHFPIAFFIGALFTAIVGRRREAFGQPVQFLVVAGGILAPIAAILGWLDAIGADPDPLLTVHRWLGTFVGVLGLGLGVWALVKPGQNRSIGMIIGLSVITAAVIIQGWYGGALVHGADHMNF